MNNGRYGEYGGQYISETLMNELLYLEEQYYHYMNDPDFVEDGSFGTPLTLIIEDGKVVDYISGSRTKSQLVRDFKKAGLIQ